MPDHALKLCPEWLEYPETRRLIALAGDAPLYFRGGTVRDALLGVTPRDIDLVVDIPRPELVARLEPEGFSVSAAENARTVLAKINGVEYDIVAATSAYPAPASLVADSGGAVPLDFTINSLYLSPQGRLLDYYGGAEDLRTGRVRFAVDARQRITENYAHILRFFRFHARYGSGEPDAETAQLCTEYAGHIRDIPIALMDANMFRLFVVPRVATTLESMRRLGILEPIFGFAIHSCDRVATLEMLENLTQTAPDSHLRLAVLLLHAHISPLEALARVRQAWAMPDDSYWWKYHILAALPQVHADMPFAVRKSLREKLGALAFRHLLLLGWTMERDPMAVRVAYETMLERENENG